MMSGSRAPAVVPTGRGDKRTAKGKRSAGSFGNSRPRNAELRKRAKERAAEPKSEQQKVSDFAILGGLTGLFLTLARYLFPRTAVRPPAEMLDAEEYGGLNYPQRTLAPVMSAAVSRRKAALDESVDKETMHTLPDGVKLAQELATAKFDETMEFHRAWASTPSTMISSCEQP
jgi:ribosomal small subunit protein bTHX